MSTLRSSKHENRRDLRPATESVTVQAAGDLVETDRTSHTDIDRQLFDQVPIESASSSVGAL